MGAFFVLSISGCGKTTNNPLPPPQVPIAKPTLGISASDTPEPTDVPAPSFETTADGDVILPPVTANMFQLSAIDAALFDGALNQDGRFYGNIGGIAIPSVGVYGQYEDGGKLYLICEVFYQRYYADAGINRFTGMGSKSTEGRAILVQNEDGSYICETFDLTGDSGDGMTVNPLIKLCGPLEGLPDKIMDGSAECTNTFSTDIIDQYCKQIGFHPW